MPESRRQLSIPLRFLVTRPDGGDEHAYAVNLSITGACVHMSDPPGAGEKLALHFLVPPDEYPIHTTARVVWTTEEAERGVHTRYCEVGVHFDDLDERGLGFIRRFVET